MEEEPLGGTKLQKGVWFDRSCRKGRGLVQSAGIAVQKGVGYLALSGKRGCGLVGFLGIIIQKGVGLQT